MAQEYSNEIKDLIVARIESTIPTNLKLFVGKSDGISREEMLIHVRKGDAIGNTIIKNQINFLKAVSSGKLVELLRKV